MWHEGTKFRIYIPTYNCLDKVKATMESIINQTIDHRKIEVLLVDYDSTDGTYEKLLTYAAPGIGIYRVNHRIEFWDKDLEYKKIANCVLSQLNYCNMKILPGDKLYPNCLKYVDDALTLCECNGLYNVICEVDICTEDGDITYQQPLYSQPFIITQQQAMEYIKRGYRHRILFFSENVSSYLETYDNIFADEPNIWNYKYLRLYQKKCLYIPQSLGLIQEHDNNSELEIMMMLYASLLGNFRAYDNTEYKVEKENQMLVYQNMCNHVLWRSYRAWKNGNKKDAQDCLQFSAIINPEIVGTSAYKKVEKVIQSGNLDELVDLDELIGKEICLAPPQGAYILQKLKDNK